MKKCYFYLYKITNKINGKFYVGVHHTYDLSDNYFGSGTELKEATKEFGKNNFIIEILEWFENKSSMYLAEKEIVDVDFVKRDDTYNLTTGGFGGGLRSEKTRRKHSESISGEKHYNYGGHLSERAKKKQSEAVSGENNHNYGKKFSEETRNKMSLSRSGKNNPLYGTHNSEETKKKRAISRKLYYENKKMECINGR